MARKRKTVGVIMLDTRFPRLVGDIGNPEGYPFEILYERVTNALPRRIVEEQDPAMLTPFIEAGRRLVAQGAGIITTSCGFLACFQTEMQAALSVPVLTSALLMLPELEARYGTGNVAILTISPTSMDQNFREKAHIMRDDLVIAGPRPKGEFASAILSNRASFDVDACERDLVDATSALCAKYPPVTAILLECTNMPPYADAIRRATGCAVYSLNDLLSEACSLK